MPHYKDANGLTLVAGDSVKLLADSGAYGRLYTIRAIDPNGVAWLNGTVGGARVGVPVQKLLWIQTNDFSHRRGIQYNGPLWPEPNND